MKGQYGYTIGAALKVESPTFYGLRNHHVITPAVVPLPLSHDTEYPPTAAEVPDAPPDEVGDSADPQTPEPSSQNRAHMCINGHMADSSSFDNHPVDLSRGAHKHPNGDLQQHNGRPRGSAAHLHSIHRPVSTAAIKREHYEHAERVICGGYPPHNGVPSGLHLSDRVHPGRTHLCEYQYHT